MFPEARFQEMDHLPGFSSNYYLLLGPPGFQFFGHFLANGDLTQWCEANAGELEMGQPEKYWEHQEENKETAYPRQDMENRKPKAGQNNPKEIREPGSRDSLPAEQPRIDEFLAERESSKAGYPECCYAEGYSDDGEAK